MIKGAVSTIRYPAGCIGRYQRILSLAVELSMMLRLDSDREEFRKRSRRGERVRGEGPVNTRAVRNAGGKQRAGEKERRETRVRER